MLVDGVWSLIAFGELGSAQPAVEFRVRRGMLRRGPRSNWAACWMQRRRARRRSSWRTSTPGRCSSACAMEWHGCSSRICSVMKIDLHVHASERSGCSVSPERDLIRAARRFGSGCARVHGHDRLVPPTNFAALNEQFAPFRVFSGIEIHTQEEEDFLVFGIQNPPSRTWGGAIRSLSIRPRTRRVRRSSPTRTCYRDTVDADVWSAPPDAVETRSTNINPRLRAAHP